MPGAFVLLYSMDPPEQQASRLSLAYRMFIKESPGMKTCGRGRKEVKWGRGRK